MAVALLGRASVLEPADDLVALVVLVDVEVDTVCEDASLSKVRARYTGGNAG